VRIDHALFTNAIVNFAINVRDAMPNGLAAAQKAAGPAKFADRRYRVLAIVGVQG
jgi:hypothetical protein